MPICWVNLSTNQERLSCSGKGGYCIQTAMGDFAKSKKGRAFLDENISHMVHGMAAAGYIPKEALVVLDHLA